MRHLTIDIETTSPFRVCEKVVARSLVNHGDVAAVVDYHEATAHIDNSSLKIQYLRRVVS
jgi:hypothetical protein